MTRHEPSNPTCPHNADPRNGCACAEVYAQEAGRLARLAASYRRMPNGGAALTVSANGKIGDGMRLIADFDDQRRAEAALRSAGFVRISYGWKLTKGETR